MENSIFAHISLPLHPVVAGFLTKYGALSDAREFLHNWNPGHTYTRRYILIFSPDGRFLVTLCIGSGLMVYETDTWQCISHLPVDYPDGSDCDFKPCAFSRNGMLFAIIDTMNSSIRIMNTDAWMDSHAISIDPRNRNCTRIRFSADDAYLVVARDCDVEMYDVFSWDVTTKRLDIDHGIDFIDFSPCGKYVAYGGGNSLVIGDARTWEPIETISCETVTSVSFTQDSHFFAIQSGFRRISEYAPENRELLRVIDMRDVSIHFPKIAISPDSRFIAYHNDHSPKSIMDMRTGIHYGSDAFRLQWYFDFSHDGTMLAGSNSESTSIFRSDGLDVVREIPNKSFISDCRFSGDNKHLVLRMNMRLTVLALGSIDIVFKAGKSDRKQSCAFSSNGSLFYYMHEGDRSNSLRLDAYDCSDWSVFASNEFDGMCSTAMVLSPRDDLIACGTDDGSILIIASEGLALVETIKGFSRPVHTLEFSPDANYLCAFNTERSVLIDMTTKSRLVEEGVEPLSPGMFSPNGLYLVFTNDMITVRDLKTRDTVFETCICRATRNAAAFAGNKLVIFDCATQVIVYDSTTWEILWSRPDSESGYALISRNCDFIALQNNQPQKKVTLIDLETGTERACSNIRTSSRIGGDFSPDGKMLTIMIPDGSLSLRHVPSLECIVSLEYARDRIIAQMPTEPLAPFGFFYTSDPSLVSVVSRRKEGGSMIRIADGKDRSDYIEKYCQRARVIEAITDFESYKGRREREQVRLMEKKAARDVIAPIRMTMIPDTTEKGELE